MNVRRDVSQKYGSAAIDERGDDMSTIAGRLGMK